MLNFEHRLYEDIDFSATTPSAFLASITPTADADILAMLATGEGPGHLVRTQFEDCAFKTLDRLAAAHARGLQPRLERPLA